ncbi:hypothetical protein [Maribacter sp. R86514]|uniref:hypothetical protein n=1 Tax=Maribacter sp. R86514 TaxID=3093854 RepID=UPI0037CBFC60
MENIIDFINKNESEIDPIKRSLFYAFLSFVIGSIIFGLFYWSEYIGFALFGILFLIFAIVFNSAFLIKILMKMNVKKTVSRKYLYSILILLINIPIAIIYFQIAMNIIIGNLEMD